MIQDLEYWKKRCELAENVIKNIDGHDADIRLNMYIFERFINPGKYTYSLKKLYEMLFYYMQRRKGYLELICNNINNMHHLGIFTDLEKNIISTHFLSQRPTKELHPEYYHETNNINGPWWQQDPQGWYLRKMFITKLIHIENEKEKKAKLLSGSSK